MTAPLVVRSAQRPAQQRPSGQPPLQRLVDGQAGARSLTILRNDCKAGDAVREHFHDVEEVLLVVSGACTVTTGEHSARLGEGDAVVIPAGQLHHFGALEDGTLTFGVLAGQDARTHYPG